MEQGGYDQALKSADKALACPKTGDDDDAHWWAQLSKREIFRKKNDYVAAEASGKQLIEVSKNDEDQFEAAFVSLVPDKADEMTKADLALAEKLLEYAGTVVTDAGVKTKLQEMQFGLLILKKDYPAIHGRVEQILKTPNIETDALVEFAGLLLAEEKPDKAMLALAEKVMVRANEITKGQEAELLAGLADIYAMQGNWTNATETLTKALATVTDDELKQYLQKTLDEYKAKPNPAAPDHDEDECDGHAPRPTKSDPK
jgi:tetratricopeptide (TPR) repeat protein